MKIEYYIVLAIALFCIGVTGVLIRRNAIIIFMCVELMLNAVNLLLVAFSKCTMLRAPLPIRLQGLTDSFCILHYGSGCCRSKRGVGHCNDVS